MFVVIYLVMFFICSIVNNYVYWWSVFLLLSLSFFFLNKFYLNEYSSLNYFIIQESLGLLFLFFVYLNFQWLILMVKMGVSPFIFWVFSIVNNLSSFTLFWFLTFQKLPFMPVVVDFMKSFVYFFFIGLLLIYFILFGLKKIKFLIFLNSSESFIWVLVNLYFSVYNFLFLFIYYLMIFFLFINYSNKLSLSSLGLSLFMINFPFMPSFFLKFISLSYIISFSVLNILILVTMILGLLSLSYLFFFYFLVSFNSKVTFNKFIWILCSLGMTFFI